MPRTTTPYLNTTSKRIQITKLQPIKLYKLIAKHHQPIFKHFTIFLAFLSKSESAEMIALLLNIIFFSFNVLFSLISRVIFTFVANLVVLAVQSIKVPGEAAKGVLEQLAGVIKACLEYLLELVMEIISSLVSSGVDLLKEAVVGSASGAGSAIVGLVEKTRESLQGLLDTSELFEGFSEMIWTTIGDLWSHYKDAVSYVMENIAG